MPKLKNYSYSWVLRSLRIGNYRLTYHARQRMSERGVQDFDIRCCGANGFLRKEGQGKFRVTGRDLDGEELTVMGATEEDVVIVITVF